MNKCQCLVQYNYTLVGFNHAIFPSDNTTNQLHEGIIHRVGNGLGKCEGNQPGLLCVDNMNILSCDAASFVL